MFLKMTINEYGTSVSEYLCETCFTTFTVCPAQPDDKQWENCLGPDCPSYDGKRDADKYFDQDREHNTDSPDCWCEPRIEEAFNEKNELCGRIVIHNHLH